MKLLAITLISSVLLIPVAYSGFLVLPATSKDSLNIVDSLGRKQGHWTFTGEDIPNSGVPAGTLLEEGMYENDLRVGMWTRYLADGRIAAVMMYETDLRKNTSVRTAFYYYNYHANGKLKKKPVIGKCSSAADYVMYDESGELLEAENFDTDCNTTFKLQRITKGEMDSIEVFRLNNSFREIPLSNFSVNTERIDLDQTGEYCVDYNHRVFLIGTFLNGSLLEGREIEVDEMMRPQRVTYVSGGEAKRILAK